MADELDLLETPVGDVEEVVDPETPEETPGGVAKPEEPYLAVNERTVYKTKDEAIRGYNEAASRIAQLSGWEKTAKQYGLTDPREFEAVANELLAARTKLAEAAKQVSKPAADPKDPKAQEAKQVREYLIANGFISKDEQTAAMKELQDRLDRMEQSGTRSEEARFENQEVEARNEVGTWLTASGIKDDAIGTKLAVVGTLIKDWINNDPERVDRWSRGTASAKILVKEGYDFALKALDWKGTTATPGVAGQLKPTDPGYAAAKARALAANKHLPAPGTAKHGDGTKPVAKKGGINAALHDRAWAEFQKD